MDRGVNQLLTEELAIWLTKDRERIITKWIGHRPATVGFNLEHIRLLFNTLMFRETDFVIYNGGIRLWEEYGVTWKSLGPETQDLIKQIKERGPYFFGATNTRDDLPIAQTQDFSFEKFLYNQRLTESLDHIKWVKTVMMLHYHTNHEKFHNNYIIDIHSLFDGLLNEMIMISCRKIDDMRAINESLRNFNKSLFDYYTAKINQ